MHTYGQNKSTHLHNTSGVGTSGCLLALLSSKTKLMKLDIDIGDAKPIHQRFYGVSEQRLKITDQEVKQVLDKHLSAPCLLTEKCKSARCTDYHEVNAVTEPDYCALHYVEDRIHQVGAAIRLIDSIQ